MTLVPAILAAALAIAAGSAHAQVFKCVDANGKTVYLQSPCPSGAKSTRLAAPASPAAAAPAPADKKGDPKAASKGPQTAAEREMEFRKRQVEKEAADKKAAEESSQTAALQENCIRAKEQMSAYEAGGRISRVNPQGERYFLDDNQLASEKAKAQLMVAQNCK